MKIIKKLATFIVLAVIALSITAPVYAARPYKDVIKREDPDAYKAIKYLKKHHAFDGVIKGDIYCPDKSFTVKQYLKILINICGKKNVPITKSDRKKFNKKVKAQWAVKKLYAVAKRMGKGSRKWLPVNMVVDRGTAAYYVYYELICVFKIKPRK